MPEEQTNDDAAGVVLRLADEGDEAFLQAVYASARASELAQVPWDEAQRAAFVGAQFAAQQLHYRTHCPEAVHQIILCDGQRAGRIYVDRREREIRIMDVTLLPEYRGRGIGTSLVKPLMEEATRAGKGLTIYVENFNPSQSFFHRLGFRQIDQDGFLLLLEWRTQA